MNAKTNTKTAKIARLMRITETHARVVCAGGALFERDSLEFQRVQDEVFALCTDEELLALDHPMMGLLYDQSDIDEIRKELAE
ncbi:MAG: hypothetical protein GY716_15890 [bacterium]|nr:hypothetical protein [bacterium]